MKKLIRAKTTQKFLKEDGGWTEDISEAWKFTDESEGRAAVARLHLLDVELYYSFDEFGTSQWDFALRSSTGDSPEAGLERSKSGGFRVLLRQQQSQKYLQPSGEWSESRETAREFASSLLAYWWAKEQQLLGIDVLMAYADAEQDFVSMRT